MTCSAGTYIRSLAYDIGEALGVGAHLAGLTRTASGMFTLENAVPLDTLLIDPADHLIPPSVALREYPALVLDAAAEAKMRHGRAIAGALADGTMAMAYGADGSADRRAESRGRAAEAAKSLSLSERTGTT